jgi:3-hydroxyisobutyrate dehydrogenase-like beta-hydroxyacid dehydrogenase
MTISVCFIGLGNMGSPMAFNLLKNHVKLFVYNRSKEKASKLVEAGAQLLESPQEAFEHAPIVFSMVANDEALKAITEGKNGLLEKGKPGCIHVSMSTISPKLSRELAGLHQEKGVHYLAAPVFGRPDAAEQQKLVICVSGNDEAKKRVEPLLRFLGQKIYDLGNKPELANGVKLTGNFLILTVVEALSEAYAFAQKSGISLQQLHTLLTDSLFPSPVFQTYGQLILSQQFEPAEFKMHLGLKDMDLFLRAADALRVPLPIAGLLHDRLLAGLANKRGEMDWSAISLTEFEEAGLIHQAPTPAKH